MELGDEFASLFAPGAPYRADDIEVANQEDQVRRFWQWDNLVIVIDRSIFAYFSKKMGHAMSEVDLVRAVSARDGFQRPDSPTRRSATASTRVSMDCAAMAATPSCLTATMWSSRSRRSVLDRILW